MYSNIFCPIALLIIISSCSQAVFSYPDDGAINTRTETGRSTEGTSWNIPRPPRWPRPLESPSLTEGTSWNGPRPPRWPRPLESPSSTNTIPSNSAPSNQDIISSSTPSVDAFQFLDNGIIRLGIDLSRGGSIGWLGPSSNQSLSLLNVHDFGREVQGSFYSGPNVFNPNGKCSEPGGWGQPWPWNPIGSGDVYLHA